MAIIKETLMNRAVYKVKPNEAIKMLNVDRIFLKRDEAIKNNKVWDFSTDDCKMSVEKLNGNLRFLLQRKTQNFVRKFIQTEDVNDTKLGNILENQIKSEAGILHLLRIAKFGLRELANESYAFDHTNVYDYVTNNGIPDLCGVTVTELANVIPMTNDKFKQIVQKTNDVPFVYYALIKYALRVMLQQFIENNGECEMD